MPIREDLLDLLRTDPAFREEVRRQLLTDELLGLPALVRELVEAQRRTDTRLDRLAEQVQRLAEQVERQGGQLQRLAEQVERQGGQLQRLGEQVGALVGWQRGEAGRRDGERYERDIVRRAPALFNGGQGGTADDPGVRQRLADQLRTLLDSGIETGEEDPFLADLLWWKADQVAVVEVSLQVNGHDVSRAAARAATLARAGARALAVVIGEEWSGPTAARQADAMRVEWKAAAAASAASSRRRNAGGCRTACGSGC